MKSLQFSFAFSLNKRNDLVDMLCVGYVSDYELSKFKTNDKTKRFCCLEMILETQSFLIRYFDLISSVNK